MNGKRPRSNGDQLEPADRGRLLAAGPNRAGQAVVYQTLQLQEHPNATNFNSIVERCRIYRRDSEWLGIYLKIKAAVLNYGLELVPGTFQEEGDSNEGQSDELEAWLNELAPAKVDQPIQPEGSNETVEVESTSTNRQEIVKFIQSVWRNWCLFDNICGFWRDDSAYPLLLPIDKTTYTNTLGIETLKYRHGLGPGQIAQLSTEDQTRFSAPEILLNPANGEHFKVLTREDEGSGYGHPRLYSAVTLLGQEESQINGMHALAFALRQVKRHHLLGHEIKNGPHAGKPQHFWTKKRHTAVMKAFDKKVGFNDFSSNFDHEVKFPWPDMDRFDETMWKGSNARLMRWGGPVASMMMREQAAPYMTQILRAECLDERQSIQEWLIPVLNLAFKPPVPIDVKWSNMIFNTDRLHEELLKHASDRGFASVETTRDLIGLDHETENARKMKEAEDDDARAKFGPMFDDSHGHYPALGDELGGGGGSEGGDGSAPDGNTGAPGRPAGETNS